mmetsp:Transcript_134265/g.233324  ORF Transcript_134265/g.233324 Transcript_134265/m.233324 type:complete len:204 (-) Transcript_134265:1201-1812(-)
MLCSKAVPANKPLADNRCCCYQAQPVIGQVSACQLLEHDAKGYLRLEAVSALVRTPKPLNLQGSHWPLPELLTHEHTTEMSLNLACTGPVWLCLPILISAPVGTNLRGSRVLLETKGIVVCKPPSALNPQRSCVSLVIAPPSVMAMPQRSNAACCCSFDFGTPAADPAAENFLHHQRSTLLSLCAAPYQKAPEIALQRDSCLL